MKNYFLILFWVVLGVLMIAQIRSHQLFTNFHRDYTQKVLSLEDYIVADSNDQINGIAKPQFLKDLYVQGYVLAIPVSIGNAISVVIIVCLIGYIALNKYITSRSKGSG